MEEAKVRSLAIFIYGLSTGLSRRKKLMSRSVSLSTILRNSAIALAFLSSGLTVSQTVAQTTAPAVVAPAAAPVAAPTAEVKADVKAPKATAAAGDHAMQGKVAYYGAKFNKRNTASGERFNSNRMTMAHKTLPFGTVVRVTNVKNKKSVVVRVNDRGPSTPDRIGDLSRAAAMKIGGIKAGYAEVTMTQVGKSKAKKSMKSGAKKAKKK
jgi:rare lipoprotein A